MAHKFFKKLWARKHGKKSHQHACKKPWQFHLHLPRFRQGPSLFEKFLKTGSAAGKCINSQRHPRTISKSLGQQAMETKSHQHACKKPWQFHLRLPRFRQGPNLFEKFFENKCCCRGAPKFPGVAQKIFKKPWARKHGKKSHQHAC